MRKSKSTEAHTEMDPMPELPDKDFIVVIIEVFRFINKGITNSLETNETRKAHKKKLKDIKKNQMETIELKMQ